MISERTLRNWRLDALRAYANPILVKTGEELNYAILAERTMNERILRLTQELLDTQLLRKVKK